MSERKSKWDEPTTAERSQSDAAAAAAAAAARIAAQFKQAQQEQGQQQSGAQQQQERERDPYDGAFVKDIEVNDLINRYVLTKAQTQKQIHEETGASITTKGLWYPDKKMATEADPPLYLHVSAATKESLDKALEQIDEIIKSDMPQLIEDRQAKRLEYEQRRAAAPMQRRERMEERVALGIETLRNFNVRAKIVGPQGLFVKYIQNETGTRVQIKGQGSGFIESSTGYESQEPMYIAIAGQDAAKVAEAKELAEDLVDAVKSEHAKAQQMIMQQWGGGGGGIDGSGHQQYGYDGGYGGQHGEYASSQQYGAQQGWDPRQQRYEAQPPPPQNDAPPLPNDEQPPPPPPEEDAAPPPPPEEQSQRMAKKKTPEEEALDKYWKDYIEWEKSFKAYHGRLPNRDEGLQDAPNEYRA